MDYAAAIKWLYSTQLFGIKLGLDNIRRLIGVLGLPGGRERFIHVAGTNGKGSTCAMIDAICRAAGWRSGLFTSPHLVSFCERIRVDGRMIPESEVAWRLGKIRELVADWNPHPTFFELATALGLWWFRDQQAEVVVLETGLGGRLDATNVVTPAVSVITAIAFDHMQWLGDTLEKIAAEKAGIIKPCVPVVSAPQPPGVREVIESVAASHRAPIEIISREWTASPVVLTGRHQRWNAAIAVAAIEAGGFGAGSSAVQRGLATVCWPARFQRLGPGGRIVIDGAHNPHGARALVETWRETFGDEKADIIFGAVAQKNYGEMIEVLGSIVRRWIFTAVDSPRAIPSGELARGIPGAVVTETLAGALEAVNLIGAGRHDDARGNAEMERLRCRLPVRTDSPPVLISGSLYLAGEALAWLDPADSPAFERSAQ